MLVAAELAPQEIREQIRKVAQQKQLRFVVLVGDADPAAAYNPAVRLRCVPTHYVAAKVNVLWGSEAEIATEVAAAVATTVAKAMQDMGKVMALLKPKLAGRADMAKVSSLVKTKLGS